MTSVRGEWPGDEDAIRRVHRAAFGRPEESALVDALRDAGTAAVSLVAERDGAVVGHVLFSPVSIADGTAAALGLGPMAVLPAQQRRGVGSALVRDGLAACARRDAAIVVVLGHPEFYRRFGFRPAVEHGLRCEYAVPDDVFMVTELAPGALAGQRGLVRYHPAFAAV